MRSNRSIPRIRHSMSRVSSSSCGLKSAVIRGEMIVYDAGHYLPSRCRCRSVRRLEASEAEANDRPGTCAWMRRSTAELAMGVDETRTISTRTKLHTLATANRRQNGRTLFCDCWTATQLPLESGLLHPRSFGGQPSGFNQPNSGRVRAPCFAWTVTLVASPKCSGIYTVNSATTWMSAHWPGKAHIERGAFTTIFQGRPADITYFNISRAIRPAPGAC